MIPAGVLQACGFVLLLLLCCLPSSESLRCKSCNDKDSCVNPPFVTCSALEAKKTSNHLNKYRPTVDTTTTSESFECFSDKYNFTTSRVDYMGCIFASINGCSGFEMPSPGSSVNGSNTCRQSSASISAGRATTSQVTILAAIALAIFASKVIDR